MVEQGSRRTGSTGGLGKDVHDLELELDVGDVIEAAEISGDVLGETGLG